MAEEISLGLIAEFKNKTTEGFAQVGELAEGLASKFEAAGSRAAHAFEGMGASVGGMATKFEGMEGQASKAFAGVLRGAESALGGVSKAVEGIGSAAAKATEATAKIAAPLALAGAAGVAAMGSIGVATVVMAGNFEEATMALVTGAGESESAIESVRQGILKLAPAVGVGPEELAKGMYMIESAGYHGAEGLKVLQASAQGAKIGMADQGVVADALTTIMKDYHLSADEATGSTGQLIATVSAGKMHMQDLAGALGTVLPYAAGLKIPFQDIGAAMATMTAHGIDANRAATTLRFGLSALLNPTAPAAAAMADLGLKAGDLKAKLGSGDFVGIMQDVSAKMTDMAAHGDDGAAAFGRVQAASAKYNDALKRHGQSSKEAAKAAGELTLAQEDVQQQMDATTADGANVSRALGDVAKMFGGARGAALALTLLPNMDEFKNNIESIGTTAEGTEKHLHAWELTESTLNDQIASFKAGIQALAITIGTALMPYAKDMLAMLRDMIPSQEVLSQVMEQKVIPVVKQLVQGFVDLIQKLPGLMEQFGNILGMVGPLVGAFISFVAAHGELIAKVALVVGAFHVLAPVLSIVGTIIGALTAAAPVLGVVMAALTGPVGLIVLAIVGLIVIGKLLMDHWDQVKAFAADTWETIKQVFSKALEAIQGFVGAALSWLGEHWQTIVAILGGPIGLAAVLISQHLDEIKGFFAGAWAAITGAFGAFASAFGTAWEGLWNGISSAAQTIWAAIEGFVSGGLSGISSVLSGFVSGFTSAWEGLWNGVSSTLSGVWNGMKGIVQSAVDGIKGILNGLIGGWNRISFSLPSVPAIHLPGGVTIGGFGGASFGVPKIPLLDNGGVVRGPGLVAVGPIVEQMTPLTGPGARAGGSSLSVQFINNGILGIQSAEEWVVSVVTKAQMQGSLA